MTCTYRSGRPKKGTVKVNIHSGFDSLKFNAMIRDYNQSGAGGTFEEVCDYEDFCSKYPLTHRDDLRAASEKLVEDNRLSGCYVVSTSGTTSTPLVMANRIWKKPSEDSYPKQFYDYLVEHVFAPEDVVANLFFPGGFGLLYEGTCRFLEPIGVTILPIGRLDSFENDHAHFQMFRRLGLNTLIGSPASIVEFAQTAQKLGVQLDIRKLVFSGESFYPRKREYIGWLWPSAQFYSLYGATEFGLACIGTPKNKPSHHHLFEDWFFMETDGEDNIYVTDLKGPLIPIIRYRVGDQGSLVKRRDGSTQLVLRGRSDNAFNCGGALIKYETVCEKVRNTDMLASARDSDVQLILQSGSSGQDVLKVVLDLEIEDDHEIARSVWRSVCSIKEIAEDVERGAIELHVHGRTEMVVSSRSKRPAVLDLRYV